MSRAALVEKVKEFCGPMGPFCTAEELHQRLEEFGRTLSEQETRWLLELQIRPPQPSELSVWEKDTFSVVVLDLLTWSGQSDPEAFLRRIGPLLLDDESRKPAIELIGWFGYTGGLRLLAPLVDRADTTDDELLAIFEAALEIRGDDAKAIVDHVLRFPHANMVAWHQRLRRAARGIRIEGLL